MYFEEFYNQHSFGRLKINIDRNAYFSTIDTWRNNGGNQIDKYDLTKKIMESLDSDQLNELEENFDFAILINVQSNSSYFKPTGFSFIKKPGASNPAEVLGTTITNYNLFSYNFVKSFDDNLKYTIPHEAGHMFGYQIYILSKVIKIDRHGD